MTVIAAIVEEPGKSILIAADSGGLEDPGRIRLYKQDKLRKRAVPPIAWAGAGPYQVAQDFTEWLQSQEDIPSDIETFGDKCAEKLATLNGRRRELMELARVKPTESDTAKVLMVAWIGGEGRILGIDDTGGWSAFEDTAFAAAGTGGLFANTAWMVLEEISFPSQWHKLSYLMHHAATRSQQCELPIRIWRVTAEGVSEATAPPSPPAGGQEGQGDAPEA